MSGAPIIHAFFDEPTNTVSYLVADPQTRKAAVIDPVLDYDHKSGKASAKSAALASDPSFRGTTNVAIMGTSRPCAYPSVSPRNPVICNSEQPSVCGGQAPTRPRRLSDRLLRRG